jgi:hypothetical protein
MVIGSAAARLAGGVTIFAVCCGTRAYCGAGAIRGAGELRGAALRGIEAAAFPLAPRCGAVDCFLAKGIDGNFQAKAGPIDDEPEFGPLAPAAAAELLAAGPLESIRAEYAAGLPNDEGWLASP